MVFLEVIARKIPPLAGEVRRGGNKTYFFEIGILYCFHISSSWSCIFFGR
jgi:hypothetical protein